MAQYFSFNEPLRHSTTEDGARHPGSDTERHADYAYRGHRVVDDQHRPIGRVTDIILDETGMPKWAVVSPGVFRAEHFLPLHKTYLSLEGNLVAQFDRRTVARSPKAERNHVLSPNTERALEHYYRLAA
jgi:PRC-barrel domain protein